MHGDPQLESAPKRVNILGVGIHATNPSNTISLLESFIDSGITGYVCVTGVHGIIESQHDPVLKKIHNSSLLTVPDGMPAVWMGWLKGHESMRRTYGPDLMFEICKTTCESGHSHFLYGGKEGVAEELRQALQRRFPALRILGTLSPPFRALTEAEENALARTIDRLRPDYLWVGLSTPKQERFMASHLHLKCKIMLGVGAAFDLHTGRMVDAPMWMKNSGLQWLHRLFQEPRRLGPRYLMNNPLFLWKITLQILGISRHI